MKRAALVALVFFAALIPLTFGGAWAAWVVCIQANYPGELNTNRSAFAFALTIASVIPVGALFSVLATKWGKP